MKESIRKLCQYLISKSSFFFNDGEVLLFPRWNVTLSKPINNAVKNGCKILFVDNLKDTFNWRYLTEETLKDEQFLNKFLKLENNARKYLYDYAVNYFVVDRFTRDSLNLHAFLCASNFTNTKTVYLDHGETGSIHPNIPFDRLLNWDYVYVTNTDMKRYYQDEAKKYNLRTEIKEWIRPRYITKYKKKNNKQTILYAPQFIEADRFDQLFPQTLQYKHREKLLNAFDNIVRERNIKVIWKTYKPGNLLHDPIKNLSVNTEVFYSDSDSFEMYLEEATMFITDCISTTIYDAIDDKIPSLCLRFYKAAETRESILKLFGESIFVYRTVDEAINKMNEFIDDCLNGLDNKYYHEIEYNPEKFPWEK